MNAYLEWMLDTNNPKRITLIPCRKYIFFVFLFCFICLMTALVACSVAVEE